MDPPDDQERIVVDLDAPGPPPALVISLDEDPSRRAPGPQGVGRTRRRRWPWMISLAVLLGVVALSGAWLAQQRWSARDDGLGDPSAVELPAADEPEATVTYLEAVGAPLVALVPLVSELLDDDGGGARRVAACRRLATEDLPELGEPNILVLLATAIPDHATGEMVLGHLAALMEVVADCGPDRAPSDLSELEFHHTIVQRRFDQLGVG